MGIVVVVVVVVVVVQLAIKFKHHVKKLLTRSVCYWCAGNVLEVVIGGLAPEAQYQFQVAAYTRKGDGERSRPKKIRTRGAGISN